MPGVSVPVVERSDPAEAVTYWAEVARGPRVDLPEPRVVRYSLTAYPLVEVFGNLLERRRLVPMLATRHGLDLLHEVVAPTDQVLDQHETNALGRAVYETSETFRMWYAKLLREVVVPIVGADCLYQRHPTVRVHFPRMPGRVWRDRVHTDLMLGHPPCEVNVWIPLTRCHGTSGMRIADVVTSQELLGRFDGSYARFATAMQTTDWQTQWRQVSRQLDMAPGELLVFDPRCLHGAQWNAERHTRVSIDARVCPVEDLERSPLRYVGTGRRQMPFERGAYYDEEVLSVGAC